MKNFILIAALALTLTSCGKTEDRYAQMLNDYAAAIKDAKTMEDVQKAAEKYEPKLQKFAESHEAELQEIGKDPKRSAVVQEAFQNVMKATFEKASNLDENFGDSLDSDLSREISDMGAK